MNRTVKVSMVAGVLFGGIALALFFKKDPTEEPVAGGDPAGQASPADVELPELTPQERPPQEQPAERRPTVDSPSADHLTGGGTTDRWGKAAGVPKVSPNFQPSTRQPANTSWQQPTKNDPFSDRLAPTMQAAASALPRTALKYHVDNSAAPPVTAQPARVHKIADGDTLDALALRYYGDATASTDIFAANRNVLSDPDLLPIGRQLRIPARDHVATKSSGASTTKSQDDEPLVPVRRNVVSNAAGNRP